MLKRQTHTHTETERKKNIVFLKYIVRARHTLAECTQWDDSNVFSDFILLKNHSVSSIRTGMKHFRFLRGAK